MSKTKKIHGTSNALLDFINGADVWQVADKYGYSYNKYTRNGALVVRICGERRRIDARSQWQLDTSYSLYTRETTRYFLYKTEEERRQVFEHGGECKDYEDFCIQHCVPNDTNYKTAEAELENDKIEYYNFFEYILKKNRINTVLINDIAKRHNKLFQLVPTQNTLHVIYRLTKEHYFLTLQDWLEIRHIIRPSLDERDTTLEMVKMCRKCKKFFIANTKKTLFCSPSCRVQSSCDKKVTQA